jgi:hypothetical protein
MKNQGPRDQGNKGESNPPNPKRCHPERGRESDRVEGPAVAFPSADESTAPPRLRYYTGPLLLLFAALVAVIPQLIRGNSCGHDFDVHLVSWLDCVNAWRHGIPYPHWAPSPNYGAGEPRFVFYPPLTWMLGAVLGLVLPWHLAPIALTFLILAATGLATRALALEALDDLPATLAGCASLFSTFTLFTAYERSAFPEFAGGFWLPLIVLFVIRDHPNSSCPIHSRFLRMGGNPQTPDRHEGKSQIPMDGVPPVPRPPQAEGPVSEAGPTTKPGAPGLDFETWDSKGSHQSFTLLRRAFNGSTALLALALAGAWLSNLPLGVMAGYLMAAVALLCALLNKSWVPMLRAAVAAVLGLGIAAIYWLPAAIERNWVDIKQATQDPGYNFENNWLFAHSTNPLLALHDQILHQVSWIAISMIAIAVAAIAISWRRGTLPAAKSVACRLWWVPLAAIPAVVCFFLFPISRPLWYLLPEMRFLQYPWRWLEAVEAPMAIFFVTAIWPTERRARVAVLVVCSAVFLASTLYAAKIFFQVCYPEDTVASTLFDYRAGAGFEGMYEYEPPGGDDSSIATGLPDACLVSDPSIVLGKPDPDDPDANPIWSSDQSSCQTTFHFVGGNQTNPEHREIRAETSHAGYLILRLVSYPAWRIRINGQLQTALPRRDDGLIIVPVSQGPVDVTVDWTRSPDILAGRWVSAVSALLLIALWWVERRSGPARLT